MLKFSFRSLEYFAFNARTCRGPVPTDSLSPPYPHMFNAAANFCTSKKKVTMKGHEKSPEISTYASKKANSAPLGLNVVKVPSLVSAEKVNEEFGLTVKKSSAVIARESVEPLSVKQLLQAAVEGSAEEVDDTAEWSPTGAGEATGGAVTTRRRLRWTSELVRKKQYTPLR